MILEQISLRNSGRFPAIICDYLDQDPFLREFYNVSPDIASYGPLIENRKAFSQGMRDVLGTYLPQQYQTAGITPEKGSITERQIALLNEPDTFTVTTGHQLSLFTGPLFFHYKIITTIKLARELKKAYPDYNFVPVFWMASEDHDFAEINHVNIFNKLFSWDKNSKEQAVGRLGLEGIEEVIAQLQQLANTDHAKQVVDRYTKPYLQSQTLSIATLRLVHELYGKEGLVVIEPDSAVMKAHFTTAMEHDMIGRHNFTLLKQTNDRIKQRYKPQVNGREINFFYLSEQGRKLMRFENDRYHVADTEISFSEEQLKQEIAGHPERFSPNVVMRPLYQETILPNLAYIGGPGELSYWLQLKPVFDENKLPFPVLQMRETYIYAGQGLRSKLEKEGLQISDLLKDDKEIIKQLVQKQGEAAPGMLAQEALDKVQALIDHAQRIDSASAGELIKVKNELGKNLNKLAKTLNEKQKEKYQAVIDKVLKLKSNVLINNDLSERVDNSIGLELNNDKGFRESVLEIPFSPIPDLKIIS